jgi:hypothetical protein
MALSQCASHRSVYSMYRHRAPPVTMPGTIAPPNSPNSRGSLIEVQEGRLRLGLLSGSTWPDHGRPEPPSGNGRLPALRGTGNCHRGPSIMRISRTYRGPRPPVARPGGRTFHLGGKKHGPSSARACKVVWHLQVHALRTPRIRPRMQGGVGRRPRRGSSPRVPGDAPQPRGVPNRTHSACPNSQGRIGSSGLAPPAAATS